MAKERIHFLTGRLAEGALRDIVRQLADQLGFEASVQVMPISVAALMTTEWIAPRLQIPPGTNRVILPGYCQGNLEELNKRHDILVERGPKDMRDLPAKFAQQSQPADLSSYDIEIIAEVNLATRLPMDQFLQTAQSYTENGADVIDIGAVPGEPSGRVGDYVHALVDRGCRVSIDSMDANEVGEAVAAGAELVLSVNKSNREASVDWGCDVVVIPDELGSLDSMVDTMEFLDAHRIPFRLDPVLEPLGLGLVASLDRYLEARRRWPNAEMLMGVGNLTELSDVDSAGVNFILMGICQELGIRSVLTTQVINWARSSIAECDVARRIARYACTRRMPAKHISHQLVVLRDARLLEFGEAAIVDMAAKIKDANYRIFVSEHKIHLLGSGEHFTSTDVFELFDQLVSTEPGNLDPSHSFYLGYELCKASISLQLGKNYIQDESLDWGHLTVPEQSRHRLSRRKH